MSEELPPLPPSFYVLFGAAYALVMTFVVYLIYFAIGLDSVPAAGGTALVGTFLGYLWHRRKIK